MVMTCSGLAIFSNTTPEISYFIILSATLLIYFDLKILLHTVMLGN
jgi:hypothetical protein